MAKAALTKAKRSGVERAPYIRPKSEKEWLDQERAEEAEPARRQSAPEDPIDELVGSGFKIWNESRSSWGRDRWNRRVTVSRFYPHQNVAYDQSATNEAEALAKKELLNRAGIAYVYVLPGKTAELSEQTFKTAKAEAKAKALKPA